ncbi:glycerate kinase type-2 family protein [Roseiterribacter gracilis]|uniref:Hydroxypyruvate reductase n=1 Tax=Roseiterribacter gracilis TaxID=2812848 RepID=A0A8S8X7H0_9PROT|nr:hydroxypyruvate reductase [Rhodospirillales bacterium TMPK1]
MSAQRALLERAYRDAVAAAHPSRVVPAHLPPRPAGRTIVLAVGKASAAMAQALEAVWDGPLEGLVTARHGYALPLQRLELIQGAHPVPDAGSEEAARRSLALAKSATEQDSVLVLLSGGASALWALPGEGLTLAAKQQLVRALLRSGADITEMNCVRRHLSAIKGGRLAAAAFPAPITTLAISDVVGDRPEAIGSGPTVADPTTLADARAVLARYKIDDPGAGWSETPKKLERANFKIIASAPQALASAADSLRGAGYMPVLLGDSITGEAREIGAAHAALARARKANGERVALLSGGELTVTVTGDGRGGPNQEYALALARALDGLAGVHAFAGDTDGADGSHDVAGAFVAPDTLDRARKAGFDPARSLANNDAGALFDAIGDLLVTGPTQTNVNDVRIVLVE